MTTTPMKTRTARPALDATAPERSDAELVAAIAQHNREAFAELYDRHSQAAFSLALHLTHNRALAEDSLQDAMLTVWKDAAQCRAENVRGWILQIVAHKSLRNGRVLRAGKQREKRVGELLPVNTATDGAPEKTELFAALQGKLGSLPSLDQQLIALHFGAGMTQYEISSALSIPRTTIASRIEKVLGLLRSSLSQAGFAGVPIAGMMHQLPALFPQETAPALLRAKVLGRCGSVTSRKVRSLKRTTPASAHSHLPVLVAAGMGFCLIVAYAAQTSAAGTSPAPRTQPAQPAAVTPAPVIEKTVAAPAAEPKPAEFSKRWSFKQEPPKDLEVVEGAWSWEAGKLGGTMSSVNSVAVALPIKVSARPFKMTMTSQARAEITVSRCMPLYSDKGEPVPAPIWSTREIIQSTRERFEQNECWFVGRYFIQTIDGKLCSVRKFATEYPSSSIVLATNNMRIQEMEIRSVQLDEIPAALRNPEECIARLKAEAARYAPPHQMH